MRDIVDRMTDIRGESPYALLAEAADEIERLRRLLREANSHVCPEEWHVGDRAEVTDLKQRINAALTAFQPSGGK